MKKKLLTPLLAALISMGVVLGLAAPASAVTKGASCVSQGITFGGNVNYTDGPSGDIIEYVYARSTRPGTVRIYTSTATFYNGPTDSGQAVTRVGRAVPNGTIVQFQWSAPVSYLVTATCYRTVRT